ncbi:MAG: hypothetical protein WD738_11525 [Pirellulales bacterium]
MTASKKALLTVGCVIGGAAILFVLIVAAFYFSVVSTVMKKASPDGQHTAKLVRIDGIDVIFRVVVDGRRVYSSPDFAPVGADFREQLVWSANDNIVVLEVGDERIFGYDAVEQRELSDSELFNVQFTPFAELGFEGELPSEAGGRKGVRTIVEDEK